LSGNNYIEVLLHRNFLISTIQRVSGRLDQTIDGPVTSRALSRDAFSNVIAIAIITATAATLPLPPQKRSSLDSPLEEAGFGLVWGFPVSRGFFPRLGI
jgi:hypothetical protein